MIEKATCPFCGAVGLAALRLSKKQKPYVHCAGCGSWFFINDDRVLNFFTYLMTNGQSFPEICKRVLGRTSVEVNADAKRTA